MGRRIKITEEQYHFLVNEGITLQADPSTTGGDEVKAINNTRDKAKAAGVDLKKATITVPGSKPGAMESKIINRDSIQESRLNELKKNSKVYSVDDFIKKVTK
jgi:hypothetical protein